MTERCSGRPALPPEAEQEVLELLCTNMEITGDEIVAILKRHHVAEDEEVLQDRYRRQLGQRLMASLRDDDGKREVMVQRQRAVFCSGMLPRPKTLQSIQRRIQNQIRGLDATAGKVRCASMYWST